MKGGIFDGQLLLLGEMKEDFVDGCILPLSLYR